MVAASFLPTLLLALATTISAKPVLERKSPVNMALTKRRYLSNYNVMERDLERAKKHAGIQREDDSNVVQGRTETPANYEVYSYQADINVGTPSQSNTLYTLIIDSGSSNTWVGANKSYAGTTASQQTGNEVAVSYGSGSFSGFEFIDEVRLAKNLVINNQSIGVAEMSTGFGYVDGILGIGPVGLTVSTLSPDTQATVPTVTDNLFASNTIPEPLVAISFEPFTNLSHGNGEISWGGTNSSKFVGDITFAPIASTAPANKFWGIEASVTYGSTLILPTTSGIVDTGTTLVVLSTNAFQAYANATGAVLDKTHGLLTITPAQFEQLQSLSFSVAGVEFTLNADAQTFPRSMMVSQGISSGDLIYLIVGDGGTGVDFILGMTGLERFYVVFDSGKRQVGLAYTPFTNGTFNSLN